jgi:Cu/Ag efflux protein CusF
MRFQRALTIGMAVMFLAVGLKAQTTTKTSEPGTAKVTTTKMTGEVVQVEGTRLLVKMLPDGTYRIFDVAASRQFMIDGQPKTVGQLVPGTVLNATVTTTDTPVTERTTTVTNGTVWFVDPHSHHLIVTLENGENKEYKVPEGYKFTVDGKQTTLEQLRRGMKVSGSKIVSEAKTEISTSTVVTGKSPGAK